jgi:hypothetical protein
MKAIAALVALAALGFAVLAFAPAGAETVCYTSDSGVEKCWTQPEPTLPPPPPPAPTPKPLPVEPVPTPTPIDQFCFKLPGEPPVIVCIPSE